MSSPIRSTRMVADIGGTNSRLALFCPGSGAVRELRTYTNRDHRRFEEVVARWLDELDEPRPRDACFAVAAPPQADSDRVEMLNMDWAFSGRELAARFEFEHFAWINDFEANAHALPYLGPADRQTLQAGANNHHRILATVGPGTGLGGATLEQVGKRRLARACEPGHMGLSPSDELELALFGLLLKRHDSVYAELLCSGPGLRRLYEALAQLQGVPANDYSPADISRLAQEAGDPLCVTALERFCALLGSACGDFVAAHGAYAGLYLAGGILPRMVPFLKSSPFLTRFRAKGALAPHMEQVPVYIITTAQPGLIGAAHAPL